jgi:hypothetical protein
VRVAGEVPWVGAGVLIPSVAYISTCAAGGVFVLADTGCDIGYEGDGIEERWR